MTRPKAVVSWSSGKDSAWTLHRLRQQAEVDVVALVTTVTDAFDRVSMHGVRRELLSAQAESVGLPLWEIAIPSPCSNLDYEERMAAVVARAASEGIGHMAFGDLFLEDIRRYREAKLAGSGVTPLFPLWGIPTQSLAHEMLRGGIEAYVTCVDPRQLPAALAGRRWDEALLAELPPAADPCGENGEFHTFVAGGPMFARRIATQLGEIVVRDGFVFADVLSA
ncbi:MAG TPA: hypothetical protein VGP93_09385 [Polyangiaceae bacterium]|nr:hypothetical protein [Polyangiaceae bacterium]